MVIGSPSLSDSDESYQLSTLEYSGAGFASGFLVRTVIQPLDVLKIRFQVLFAMLRLK
jgi:hypothetical protein